MYLIDYQEISKGDKKFRIATFLDYEARRKVIVKFLNPEVKVPTDLVLTKDDLSDVKEVSVKADLMGNVTNITPM